MTDQMDLFAATIEAERDALRRVDEHADPDWKSVAADAVRECARRFAEFTADEVWDVLNGTDATTHEPAALGPVFMRAARDGLIRNSGRRRKHSKYRQRHRELTIWVSLVYSAPWVVDTEGL